MGLNFKFRNQNNSHKHRFANCASWVKIWLLLFVFFLLGCQKFTSYTIEGYILSEDGLPLDSVKIITFLEVHHGYNIENISTYTNNKGYFKTEDRQKPPTKGMTYHIEFKKLGFQDVDIPYEITSDGIINLDTIYLKYEENETTDSILILNKYPSGKIEHAVYFNDSSACEEYHINYYENGIIKEKGCQGHYDSFGVPEGTWYSYDSLGIMTEKRIYKHGRKNGNVTIIKFDNQGQILEEIVQGYHPDFGELDTIWSRKTYKK